MGKNVGASFASRYYDAVALGLNIYAADYIAQGDWTRGFSFDYSLPLGKWIPIEDNPWQETVIAIEEAIEQASKVMTIRQGDLIAIDCSVAPRKLEKEEVIQIEQNNEELLYCKIK
jgi:2-keto-4-pentenoate hydratase/2-oxohepta-3-ene-1,7-dioic acid hydratase in catechol pathway